MSIQFAPLTNHLLLTLEPEPEKSKIIAVQRSIEDLARFGKVTAIGPEVLDAKVGQRVLASITAGVEMPVGMLIQESAILAYFHE